MKTNIVAPITNSELTLSFESFPKGFTLNDLNLFLEWFNSSFYTKHKNKLYINECYKHYKKYVQAHHSSNKVLKLLSFSKVLQLTLLQMEKKQGFALRDLSELFSGQGNDKIQIKKTKGLLRYYKKNHDSKAFYFINFGLTEAS